MGKMNRKDAELMNIQQNLVASKFFDEHLVPLSEVLEDMCSDNGIVRNAATDYCKVVYRNKKINTEVKDGEIN